MVFGPLVTGQNERNEADAAKSQTLKNIRLGLNSRFDAPVFEQHITRKGGTLASTKLIATTKQSSQRSKMLYTTEVVFVKRNSGMLGWWMFEHLKGWVRGDDTRLLI